MIKQNPRGLFITSHWPGAPSYGAQQRVHRMCSFLQDFCSVSLVIVSSERADEDTIARTKRDFPCLRTLQPESSLGRGLVERLRHELDPGFVNSEYFSLSDRERAEILKLISEHDLVWVHTIKTANILRIRHWPHSILDVDDLPSRVYRSSSRAGRSPLRRLLDLRMSSIWRRRELRLLSRFSVLSVCSEEDRRYLGGGPRIRVIPNGYQSDLPIPPPKPVLPPRLGFIGTFKWMPNQNGVRWFIESVWPRVKRVCPDVQLRLVGRESDGELARSGPDIAGLGFLEDPGPEIATWTGMIVPIRIGGGTRIKIAESFARRCPVVSTSVGAYGYKVKDGREILLADRAGDFATACTRLIQNRELARQLAENAASRFSSEWSWETQRERLKGIVQLCLELKKENLQAGRVGRQSAWKVH